VKNTIAEQMLLEARSKYFDKVSQDIEKDLSYGIALEDVAKKHDLPLIKAGVGQRHDLMKHHVFNDLVNQTEAGMTSQIAPLEFTKQYVIVRVDELVPASLPALDDIKPAVKAFWHHLQQKQEALALAQMITVGVAQGKNFDMICKANNIPVHRGVDVSKVGMYPWDSKLPMKVHQEAFSIPIKSITPYSATKAGDSYFVARVVGIKENKASQAEYEKTKLELEQSVVNDMLASVMAYYLDHEKIIVNIAK
jgi:uncharacterized cupredoxin-like copper-binding protein